MKEKCAIFNEVRMAYMGQLLTGKEVNQLLAELPYGKTSLILSALVATGCIEHLKKGQYQFTTHPVHQDLLNKAFEYARKKTDQYNKKYRKKEQPVVKEVKSEIQKAIELLLATGEYEIYKVEKVIKKTQIC